MPRYNEPAFADEDPGALAPLSTSSSARPVGPVQPFNGSAPTESKKRRREEDEALLVRSASAASTLKAPYGSLVDRSLKACPPALCKSSHFPCEHSFRMYNLLSTPEASNTYEIIMQNDSRPGVNWFAFASLLRTRCPNLLKVRSDAGQTILHFAARHGKTAYAGIICSMLGVDVNVEDLEADTPLIACCSGGDDSRDAAALFIQHGANVNHANSDGCSALHYSGRGRHERLVQLLVESGADWNQVNESDDLGEYWTPLCATIEQGNEAAARIMLEGGAYLDGDKSRPPLLSLRNARRCKLSAKGLRCLNALAPDPEAATIEPGHPRVQW